MNIKVNRKNLLDALRFGGMAAGKCKTVPILDYCKIAVSKDKMVVTSTDLEITIAKKINGVECDTEHGDFCVVPSDIINVLSTLRDEDVVLEVKDSECVMNHARGRVKVSVLPASDFPNNNSNESKVSFTMDAQRLKMWLNSAKNFVAEDNLRPALTGMFLAVEDGEVWCASSDSHKLFMDGYKDDSLKGNNTSIIVPSRVFGYASSLLDGYANATVKADDTNVSFVVSDAKISARLVVGNYPKVKAILPSSSPILAEVSTKDFSDSLSRIRVFADKVSNSVDMRFTEERVDFLSSDLMSNKACSDYCETFMYEGSPIDICTKVSNLEAIISKIESETVLIGMEAPNRPIIFREAGNPNKVLFTMPLAKAK